MQPGEIVAGRFEIDALAGSGGMGAVYKARDRHTGQWVAVKVLHGHGASHAERFAREAQLLSELRHPGIVRFVGSGATAQGDGFIVMEWLEGESLSARLTRGPLSPQEVIDLGARIADALRPAHERGIVHRDLKPQNLFLEHGAIDRIKVLDFGIARVLEPGQKLTITGVMLGTPGYMSPEQVRGDKEVDARTDVYALGCVLFCALTGRRVFVVDDPVSALVKVTVEEAPRASAVREGVPPALDDLLARMLAMAPARRPRDAAALLAELAVIGGYQLGATAIAPPSAQRALSAPPSFAAVAPSSFSPAPPPSPAMAPPTAAPHSQAPPAPWSSPPLAASPSAYAPTYPGPTAVGSAPVPTMAAHAPTYPGAPPYPVAPPAQPAGSGRGPLLVLLGAIAALLVVIVVGGALAMFVFWPSHGGSGGLGSGPTSYCPGERCIPARFPDPERVDGVSILPQIRKAAREIDPSAALVMLTVITSSADGTVDINNQRQFLHYHFQGARNDSRFYLWVNGERLVMNRANAVQNQKPLADPGCPVTTVRRAAGAGGGDTTMTLIDTGPPLGAIWMVTSGQASTFLDPRSCTVRRLY